MKKHKSAFSAILFILTQANNFFKMKYAMLLVMFSLPLLAQHTYYVSSTSGNDAYNGTSQLTPWKTINKTFSITYNAGDSLLFKRGDKFEGGCAWTLKGSALHPAVVGAYGSGAKPIIYGDLRGKKWTAVPGYPGIYKMVVGLGSDFHPQEAYQWINGAWSSFSPIQEKPNDPTQNKAWLSALSEGEWGRTFNRDTLFIHTFGSIPVPTSRDSIRIYRLGVGSNANSNYGIIRDLNVQSSTYGIAVDHSYNILVRACDVKNIGGLGILFSLNNYDCIADSCTTDSTSLDGMYMRRCVRCIFRNNTISNVYPTIEGIFHEGDHCAIGIQDPVDAVMDTIHANVVEYNTALDCPAGIDFWRNWGDTIQYNTLISSGGIYPNGTKLVIRGNICNLSAAGGMSAMNCGNIGKDTIKIIDNYFYNCDSYAIWADNCYADSVAAGGRIIISGNYIQGHGQFVDLLWIRAYGGVEASNNTYFGLGRWGIEENRNTSSTYFKTLSEFQATHNDNGSIYLPGKPNGTISTKPDTLPHDGYTVVLYWTSQYATSASITPTIGPVPLNGSIRISVTSKITYTLTLTNILGSAQFNLTVNNNSTLAGSVITLPKTFGLDQNFPNPFNPTTTINFKIPYTSHVSLKVYNMLGREVETLVNGEKSAGYYSVTFDGSKLSSGNYFYRIQTDSFTETKKLILLK